MKNPQAIPKSLFLVSHRWSLSKIHQICYIVHTHNKEFSLSVVKYLLNQPIWVITIILFLSNKFSICFRPQFLFFCYDICCLSCAIYQKFSALFYIVTCMKHLCPEWFHSKAFYNSSQKGLCLIQSSSSPCNNCSKISWFIKILSDYSWNMLKISFRSLNFLNRLKIFLHINDLDWIFRYLKIE